MPVQPLWLNRFFFAMQLDSPIVALARCSDYSPDSLDVCVDQLISAVGRPERLAGLQVMLKPNLISAKHGDLPCTEAAFILIVARWFVDNGAKVTIGDSPAFGSATSVLTRLGVLKDLQSLGVAVSDFDATRKLTLSSGVSATVAVDALDCDLLVNLPRVKAHAQMRVTMAVKNCFGCLAGLYKPGWHMIHGGPSGRFADLLVELLAVLPESLSLVDGIRTMHVSGPMDGRAYPLGLVAAGFSPVAVDTALLSVLGVLPERSPLQQASVRTGIPGARLENLSFPLSGPDELRVDDFLVPECLNPVRFNPFSFLYSSVRRKLILLKTRL